MKTKSVNEMEKLSIALMVILCVTSVATIIAGVFIIKDLVTAKGDNILLMENIEGIISYVFYLAIQIFAVLIFRSIQKYKTPFISAVSRNIKIIGILVMFAKPISLWAAGLIAAIGQDGFAFTFVNSSVLFGILLGLIVACIGAIFDYGCVLQKQDDETL